MMQQSVGLRRATVEDADAIRRLANELGYRTSGGVMRRRIEAVVSANTDLLLVATDSSNEPVGWVQAHSSHLINSGFCVEIRGLVVLATMRRAGIARLLLAEVETWAASIQAEAIIVRSNVTRAESHPFYLALGYEKTKTSQTYRKLLSPASR